MKLNKKKIFTIALAVCLIAILSFSSLAWFTDSDEVNNKFHVATSDDPKDPDDIFSVDVMEKIDTNDDGIVDATVDIGDVTGGGYTYEHIYPSQKILKQPIAVNTGAYDQYIRMIVTVDKAWDDLIGDLTATYEGYDSTLWTCAGKTVDGSKVIYTYYLNRVLPAGDTAGTGRETLFTHVNIPETLTQADFATLNGGFAMDVVAEAVQADNTGDNAQAAFALVMP